MYVCIGICERRKEERAPATPAVGCRWCRAEPQGAVWGTGAGPSRASTGPHTFYSKGIQESLCSHFKLV
ncbi:hypothetical protein Hanom_Chr11g01024031 [Helianthus anomalus]